MNEKGGELGTMKYLGFKSLSRARIGFVKEKKQGFLLKKVK